MNQYIREPFNGLSHLFGAILSLLGLTAMLVKVTINGDSFLTIIAIIIFGVSMILLYSSSATYHMVIAKDSIIQFLRRLDHSMIYLLIAGTYAPFCLITLKGTTGYILFIIISIIAICGILFKMVWFNCPRWISTALYIGMGWIIIFLASPLSEKIGTQGIFYLIIGGVLYTIGGIIYGLKPKIAFIKKLGFHEIFHIFILLGTLCHFICVFSYVI
ncbi:MULTISPECIES: hemolysin III family protein [Bacillaceae]|uniref:PAQR family membrane homeostasis protein TrhA n=1 Tax=Bacillaceae TaxID=186817 RepID=UPI0006FCE9E4|nr:MULTISPECIES: hemolysin III family protein [Bacillaceae]KQL35788.1 hemolysin [Psychrobacillus sp. FJAT-21963]MDF2067061.1 hemolysin III family protein [Bacillus sp. Cr_A10]